MPLFEVSERYLKQPKPEEKYRFLHDPKAKVSLHIWQYREPGEEENHGIFKFQLAWHDDVLEWVNGKLKGGKVDIGDNMFGAKRSPVMMMTDQIDPRVVTAILEYMTENNKPEFENLDFVINELQKSLKKVIL